MSLEIERKYLGAGREHLLAQLKSYGAKQTLAPHFESNTVYDNEQGTLLHDRRLLRLRRREWSDHADGLLTCKIPMEDLVLATGPVKRREEIEISLHTLSDIRNMDRILKELGYHPAGSYEKVRESWCVEVEGKSAHMDMDLLPFTETVEIEADPATLELVEHLLGLDKFPTSAKSYHVLYLEWLANKGLPANNYMVFTDDERARLRKELGLSLSGSHESA